MIKLLHYQGQNEHGNVFVEALRPGEMVKTASPVHPSVQEFMGHLKPDAGKLYVLVNALGASEFWGSNINGDWFPEEALTHEPEGFNQIPVWDVEARVAAVNAMNPQYGYTTFYNAHPFKHHANKDATKSFGRVVLAAWNPTMKRVELILEIDKLKAEEFGASDIVKKIEAGEFPDVSMGCKVPYDICLICGHVSKTRADYCKHCKDEPGLGKLLPDGQIAAVSNTIPRFFDISFVIIGADRTAKVMAKLADGGQKYEVVPESTLYLPSALAAERLGYSQQTMMKVAEANRPVLPGYDARKVSVRVREDIKKREIEAPTLSRSKSITRKALVRAVTLPLPKGRKLARRVGDVAVREAARAINEKRASQYKHGELTKVVPPGPATGKLLSLLENSEPDLPRKLLDQLAAHGKGSEGLGETLSSAGSLGVVLKPREFQRMVLTRMGRSLLADKLDSDGSIFGPTSEVDDSIPMGGHMARRGIRSLLHPLLGQRSFLGPAIRKRITICIQVEPQAPQRPVQDELLEKLSAAYNGYRLRLIDMSPEIERLVSDDPEAMNALYGDDWMDEVAGVKTASAGPDPDAAYLSPLLYLTAGHWAAQKEAGVPIAQEVARNHPWLTDSLSMSLEKSASVDDREMVSEMIRAMA